MFGLSIALLALAVGVALLGLTGIAGSALGASHVTLVVVGLALAVGSMIAYRRGSHPR